MRVAQTGLTLSLDEAKATLLDNKGNLLQFEEQKDGTFLATVEGDGYNYTYELNPQPVIVSVSVNKKPKGSPEEEKKAIQVAKIGRAHV